MSMGLACQDDLCRMMSVLGVGVGGLEEHAEDEVTHTRFSSHSSRNCWNFWDISSWALPTALRIFPMTAERHRRTCMHTRTHNSQCNYSQSRILQACCSANREAAFVMQQKRMWWNPALSLPLRNRSHLGKSNNY